MEDLYANIPPQYKGMPYDVVEELWPEPVNIPVNQAEIARRQKALQSILDLENQHRTKVENALESPLSYPEFNDEDFKKFQLKNGETDNGVYWYEYTNLAAKTLKQNGDFNWGEERIYFDIPLDKMELLAKIVMKIAAAKRIPIGFKHLDLNKTASIVLDPKSQTTRFVTNFVSIQDAKEFYDVLSHQPAYVEMSSDLNNDYHGYNIDGKAHYASGYREQREPLIRIVKTAKRLPDGSYEYEGPDGGMRKITQSQYENFKRQLSEIPDPQEKWQS